MTTLLRSASGRLPMVARLLKPEHVVLDLEATDVEEVTGALVDRLLEQGAVPAERAADLVKSILAREHLASTAIGLGVACPHAHVDYVDEPLVVFARLRQPLDLKTPDGVPTDLVFLLVGRQGEEREHLRRLTQLAHLIHDEGFREALRGAQSPAQVVDDAARAELRLAPVEGGGQLGRLGLDARSGRLGGGLLDDLRRRWVIYGSDFRDGLSSTSLAATLFLFFACFTGAVTFGALTAAETRGAIGTFEMILATAVCGVVYALFSGQPLVLLGGTGPILIFTTILYRLCEAQGLPFLPVYGWVGLWSAGFLLALALTDASVLLRYVTRFTDEVFVALMAAIFIDEAVRKLIEEFKAPHVGGYATALSSVVLALGTFGIAMVLRSARKSNLLRAWVRSVLTDFGIVIAIVAMTVLAYFMRETTDLSKIEVHGLKQVSLVGLGQVPGWVIPAAAVPALFLTILLFLTQQITARVVNSPEFNLRKGPGYHLDLTVLALLTAVSSLFGLPWLCAATVRSLNHVSALSTTHTEDLPSGTKVLTDGVLENRLTGVAIHVLIGASILLVGALRNVPMACLYGIFLYMGVVSFSGNQFFQRVTLWIQDPELYPRWHYLRLVKTRVVHGFTAIQAVAFAVLWAIKVSALAILFPLFLSLLVPLRLLLPRLGFGAEDLEILDAEETPAEEMDRELE